MRRPTKREGLQTSDRDWACKRVEDCANKKKLEESTDT